MDTYGVPTSERAPSQIPDKSHRRPTSEAYGEAVPAPEHVVHGLGHGGMAGEPGAFGLHPGLEIAASAGRAQFLSDGTRLQRAGQSGPRCFLRSTIRVSMMSRIPLARRSCDLVMPRSMSNSIGRSASPPGQRQRRDRPAAFSCLAFPCSPQCRRAAKNFLRLSASLHGNTLPR